MSHGRGSVIVLLGLIACSENRDAVAPDAATFDLSLSVAPSSGVSADGATLVRLTATIPAETPPLRRNVTFTTTDGAFVQGSAEKSVTVTAAVDGTAIAFLRAPRDSVTALVQASNRGAVRQDSITFTRALPDRVDVDIDKFGIKATPTDYATITIMLRRNSGRVSPGTPIQIRATQNSGAPIGLFGSVSVSDTAGMITVRYTPAATDYRETVTITATANKHGGGTIEGQVVAVVINP